MDTTPLVSVVVITYNSSSTVLETLDSIKNQDYPNVELIVADDCSKDDTVGIVRNWLSAYGSRFVCSELVASSKNTGVSGNLNRGWRKAHGEWVKPIAGDDLLLPDCLSVNVAQARSNPHVKTIFSRARFFGDPDICKKYSSFGYGIFGLNNREKYLYLLTDNCIIAPAAFVSRAYLESVGGYNEDIPFIEDWPFWIKMFKDNNDVAFLNRETVRYRMAPSLSLGDGGGSRFKENRRMVLEYAYDLQSRENIVYRLYAFLSKRLREGKSAWYSFLIRLNFYYYYYFYLYRKIYRFSQEFNLVKDNSNAHTMD